MRIRLLITPHYTEKQRDQSDLEDNLWSCVNSHPQAPNLNNLEKRCQIREVGEERELKKGRIKQLPLITKPEQFPFYRPSSFC